MPNAQDQESPTIEALEERVRPHIENAREQIDLLNQRVTGFVKEHPVVSMGAALLLGYLVARAAQRD